MIYTSSIKDFYSEKKFQNENIYIVTALDILGFSNFILNNYDNHERKKMDFVMKCMSNMQHRKNFKAALFSDCIFLFLKIDYRSTLLADFTNMLYEIEHFVENAMQNGFLIRGGVCVGECYLDIDNNIFYGPGIIKAYVMEEALADSARIIMDRYDYDQLISLFHYVTNLNIDQITHEMSFIKTDDYFCFDFIEAMFNYTGMNTDMNECMSRYKYWLNICHRAITDSGGSNTEKHLSKLAFHTQSYNRILSQFNPEFISEKIRILFE